MQGLKHRQKVKGPQKEKEANNFPLDFHAQGNKVLPVTGGKSFVVGDTEHGLWAANTQSLSLDTDWLGAPPIVVVEGRVGGKVAANSRWYC